MGVALVMVLSLLVSNLANAVPFLSNAPRALTTLATSASASASSPVEPLTHISDLRIKQQKAQKLQAEKQLAEEEEDANATSVEEEDVNNNEASPSLFQKKVYKILTKLRIISSICSGLNGNNNASARITDNSNKSREEVEELNSENVNEVVDIEESSTEDVPTFQKVIYPHSGYGVPLKFRLGVNEKQVDASDEPRVENEKPTGRLEQIGVFFAELVGSIFGLVYGAAAHINNSIQGTTAASLDEQT